MLYHNGTSNFDGLEREVRRCTAALREHEGEYDCIVARGLSGLSVAFPTALRLKKPLVVVRKPNEDCHGRPVVGAEYLRKAGPRCVMLDDFIASGATKQAVAEAVANAGGKLVATFCYADMMVYSSGWSRA